MEKEIVICRKCDRIRYITVGTRDELRLEGWRFYPQCECPDCRPKVKRSQSYMNDMCFTRNVLTGEETGR